MKLLFAATTALILLFTGVIGLNSPKTTVTSIRAFEEPLVAIGGDKSANYDSALIADLQTYQKRKSYEDVSAITTYLEANPNSPWKFSLLANLGIVYRKTGYFSKALDSWERAWALGKGEKKNVPIQSIANLVAADLATLLSSLGRTERLESLLKETKGRAIYGSALNELSTAKENLWLMKNRSGESFKCGPYALNSIRAFGNLKDANDPLIEKAQSSMKGFSLTQVRDLSRLLKMNYEMVKRQPGTNIIVPSVVHWKSGHYAAILKKQGDFYLTKDPTFGEENLVTAQALEDESSGYFLVPQQNLPSGWQAISDSEGDTVWGRGLVPNRTPGATKTDDKKCPCQGGGSHGMAVYSIFAMLASLSIEDTPVGYSPPVGPDMHFTITYNQLEGQQPALLNAFNFGPSWNCNWLSYVTTPTSAGAPVVVNTQGGGQETYSNYYSTTTTGYVGYYGNELQSQATLWVTTSGTYERRMPDGSKELFGQPSSASNPVFLFLTAIVDPQGNQVTLQYYPDGSNRLEYVIDADDIVNIANPHGSHPTILTYGNAGDYSKVTQITDGNGRSANFSYTLESSGVYQLTQITDVVGIQSQFAYVPGSSIVMQMTTPYGITQFQSTETESNIYYPYTGQTFDTTVNALVVTEPDGGKVKAESRIDGLNFPYQQSENPTLLQITPTEPIPNWQGTSLTQLYLQFRDTYYWDKKATQDPVGSGCFTDALNSYTAAHIYHWLHTADSTSESPVLESEKPALENRIWYFYPNQIPQHVGSSASPTAVVRVINDINHPQATQYQYNNSLNPAAVTAMIDPLNRQTNYFYDSTTGIDLTGVTQNNSSGGTDTLESITYNNSANPPHCPASVTDASGQTTSYLYNSQGQVTSVTPPKRVSAGISSYEPTTYGYTNNYLTSITGPLSGATKTITYDTLGGKTVNRVKTVADAEGYTLTYSYDNLDRVTQILYPDSTTELFSYVNPATNAYGVVNAVDLDLHSTTDRLGRTTKRIYDSVRHMTSITDPLSRTTSYHYCACGSMDSLTDAEGNVTYFNRDVETRLTSKVYPGETQPPSTPDYIYDTVGRVSTFTDKRQDVTTYSYNVDDTVSGISYALGSGSTAVLPSNVTYGYDPYYNRITSENGVGYSYYLPGAGVLGVNKLKTVTNTMTGGSGLGAVTYNYDEWGRVVGRNIDSANPSSVVFDSLGRVTNVLNLLAPTTPGFAYSYYDPSHPTNRVGGITYPNGQSTSYSYFGSYNSFASTGDENLKEIKNLTPSSTVVSQDDYTVDALGKVLTWQQQTDGNTPLLWTEGYDLADQLKTAVLTNTAITSPVVISDSYGYDWAGNLNSVQLSGVSRSPSYNALNQLTGSTPTGNQTINFTGSLNVPATVSVNGSAASISGTNFSGGAVLAPGSTTTVPVVATDSHGNTRTNHYQTTVATQPTFSPSFDADGNELTNGAGQSYTWDVKNELIRIIQGSNTYQFGYDALGRRISETDNGTLVKQWVWDGKQIAEERNATNTVTKRFFAQGEQISGASYYYTRDHLGSVREMTSGGTGTGSNFQIQARYDYDPYGRVTSIIPTIPSDFQYAGYYEHSASGLNLTLFRAYDPITSRWLSRDPLPDAERSQGPNLYEYVKNDPIKLKDPLGLCPCGQHFGFNFGAFSYTVDTMTGSGTADVGGDLNYALRSVPGEVGESAEELDPYLLGYSVAVDLGAGLGSWGCVPDSPPYVPAIPGAPDFGLPGHNYSGFHTGGT